MNQLLNRKKKNNHLSTCIRVVINDCQLLKKLLCNDTINNAVGFSVFVNFSFQDVTYFTFTCVTNSLTTLQRPFYQKSKSRKLFHHVCVIPLRGLKMESNLWKLLSFLFLWFCLFFNNNVCCEI